VEFIGHNKPGFCAKASVHVLFMRDTAYAFMVPPVLGVTPTDGFEIKIRDVSKCTACHEVVFYELNQTLYSTFVM
jgi:hypothetical protein